MKVGASETRSTRSSKHAHRPAAPRESEAKLLAPYLPRASLNWLADTPDASHRSFQGTMVFADVSGFTALTERFASKGKAGAEEITDVVGTVFGQLLDTACSYGADLLKWGGDAVLLFFAEPDSAQRATRAAFLMSREMNKLGRFRTSAGQIRLDISMSAHSDVFDLYMLGDLHRELIVTGPAASLVAELEGIAEKGEIVVSQATARKLGPHVLGAEKSGGFLVVEAPTVGMPSEPPTPGLNGIAVSSLMPADTRQRLVSDEEQGEHRQATVAFIQFTGVDGLTLRSGPDAVADHLGPVISRIEQAAERNGVNFHESDIGKDGGKVFLVGGVPVVRGNDAERVLRAATEIVSGHPSDSPIGLRAGVNTGRVFVFSHNFEISGRRIFAVTGDAVNLAARVMGRGQPGQVVATDGVLARTRNRYETEGLEPFMVKGKSEPVRASIVHGALAAVSNDGGADLPFVGRERELGQILRRAELAATGSGGVVDVVGAAGIGKSRLVSETIDRWTLSTLRVVCDEYERTTPYMPFRRILRQLIGIADDTAAEIAASELRNVVRRLTPQMEPFLPLLAELVDVEVADTREVDDLDVRFRRRRLEQFVVALLRSYISAPSALVIEDAHSIDEASGSLLGKIAEAAIDLPLLIVLTRNEDTEISIRRAEASYLSMDLEPLADEAAAQIAGCEDADALSPSDLAKIVSRAAGNPMFLRELIRGAAAAGDVDALPDTIEPLLVAEMDRLPPPDKRVLRAAAVLGTRFDLELLRALLGDVSGLDEGTLARLSSFVVPTSGGWIFTHGLMRDAAYEALPFKRRHELHALAATAIEERTADPEDAAEILSLHWLNAERYDKAWRFARLAGERARALWANADATTFYARALQAARHLELPKLDVRSVAESLGDAFEVTAEYERSRAAYAVAKKMAETDVDRARILRKTGVLHERQGRYAAALSSYSRGRRLLGMQDVEQATERSELDLASAGIKDRQGHYRECIKFAVEAERDSLKAGHDSGLAHALYLQHMMSVYLGQGDERLAEKALEIFERIGDLVGQGNVLNNMGISAYYLGNWESALALYERSSTARMRSGDIVGAATAENNVAEILSDQGQFESAGRLFESARAAWRAAGYSVGTAFAISNLGRLQARSGNIGPGRELLEEALNLFQKINSPAFIAETQLRLAECSLLEGAFEHAVAQSTALLEDLGHRSGFELVETPALRTLGASWMLACIERGDDSRLLEGLGPLNEAIDRFAELDSSYELATSLALRASLGRLTEQIVEDPTDGLRAEEIFERLGVVQGVVTWSTAISGSPIYLTTVKRTA